MCRENLKFNEKWNMKDDLDLFVDVKVMPDFRKYPSTDWAQEIAQKMEVDLPRFEEPEETPEETDNIEESAPEEAVTITKIYSKGNRSRKTRRDAAKTAKIRRVAITAARKANVRKANADGRVIILKNPRGLFIRDLANKANPGDERDRKRNRRAAKKCSNYYELPKREIAETPDIPADELGGYWDVGKQEFIYDDEFEEVWDWDDDYFEEGPEHHTVNGEKYNTPVPSAYAAFEFIREHNLYDYFVEWLRQRKGGDK